MYLLNVSVTNNDEHWSDLAGSEFMGMLTAVYFMLFLVKTTCQDWGQQYLLQERGVSAYPAAAYLTSMEVGGFIGSLTVGLLTDVMIKMGVNRGEPEKSPRMVIAHLCVAGSVLFLNLFLFSLTQESSQANICLFYVFFCMLYPSTSIVSFDLVYLFPESFENMHL